MLNRKLFAAIAACVAARANNAAQSNDGEREWFARHEETAHALTREHMPSGSGIDTGTRLDVDRSTAERLVFTFGFHHMDYNGSYNGWTEHTLTVRPSLQFEIDLSISGRDRNGIKEYLYDTYREALTREIEIK